MMYPYFPFSNMYWGIKNIDISERCKAVPYLMVETQQAEISKSLKEIEERQRMERKALLDRIAALEGEREKAMEITRETIEDAKRLKEEMLKAKGNSEGKCEEGKNCQKVIGEEELETWLAKGWEVKIVLPSGKIVIEKI